MKKLIMGLIFAMVATTSFAQFTKGRMFVGGALQANFDTDKAKNGNTTVTTDTRSTFTLTPQVGYFIMDNFAVGAGIDLTATSVKDKFTGDKDNYTSIAIAPLARYYYQNFFGQAVISFGGGNQKHIDKNTSTTTTQSFSLVGYSLGLGYAYFLNDNVAIEPQLGYAYNGQKYKDAGTSITEGLYIKLGFQIYLNKR